MTDPVRVKRVQEALLETAEPFGRRPAVPPALHWGLLFAALGTWDESYISALELVYEGYLLHYRESRVIDPPPLETGLLAGDVFYACGLRRVAMCGDIDGVALLTRLMSTCSYLRSVSTPFAADDALWASATAGLAALRRGVALSEVASLFDGVDAGLAAGEALDVVAMALETLPRLRLPRPAALLEELERVREGAAMAALDSRDDGR